MNQSLELNSIERRTGSIERPPTTHISPVYYSRGQSMISPRNASASVLEGAASAFAGALQKIRIVKYSEASTRTDVSLEEDTV